MNIPLANPVYLSDEPQFLQRQRLRAACATVSEHVPSWSCPCQKCKQAAKDRARPGFGISAPGAKEAWEGAFEPNALKMAREGPLLSLGLDSSVRATSSTAPSPVPQLGSISFQSPKMQSTLRINVEVPQKNDIPQKPDMPPKNDKRDFHWLMSAIQESFAQEEARQAEEVKRHPRGEASRKKLPSLHSKLGFKIPDSVILRHGKPRKRFSLDAVGRIQVEHLNQSAQLLRVLRSYVFMAHKRHLASAGGKRTSSAAQSRGRSKENQGKSLSASNSAPVLGGAAIPDKLKPSQTRAPEPLREAAVLYYNDGAVRYMTTAEANNQMENANRLPKDFWSAIGMLQTPVSAQPPTQAPSLTRYITYNFDAASEGFEPQAPLPLLHKRSNSITQTDISRPKEKPLNYADRSLVGSVPKRINAVLAAKTGGKWGSGATIVSGRFEFVMDEAEGVLWLVNAEKIVIEHAKGEVEETIPEEDDTLLMFFDEHDFCGHVQEQEVKYKEMKDRWRIEWPRLDLALEGTAPSLKSLNDPAPEINLVARTSAMRLEKKQPPSELRKYHQAEWRMNGYLDLMMREPLHNEAERSFDKAFGIFTWFHRWRKVTQRAARVDPNASNPTLSSGKDSPSSPKSPNSSKSLKLRQAGSGVRAQSAPGKRQPQ